MSNAKSNRSTVDLGAINWLYGEIEQVLTQTQKTLRSRLRILTGERKASDNTDQSALVELQKQLEQSTKAFSMIEAPGASEMLSSISNAISYIVARPEALTEAAVNTLDRGGFALIEYMQNLRQGQPVKPIALFPQYHDVVEITKQEALPADLWDYEWEWVDVALPKKPHSDHDQNAALSRLNQFMLSLLRGKLEAAADFKIISYSLTESAEEQRSKQFWSLATGFFDGIAAGNIELDVYTKRIASYILQIHKSYAQNKLDVSDAFAKNLLFFCANRKPDADLNNAPILAAVITAYEMEDFEWVNYSIPTYGRVDPSLISQIQKRISAAKASWSSFCFGEPIQLQTVVSSIANVSHLLKTILPESQGFADTLLAAITAIVKTNKAPAPEVALEIATSILYLEATFNNLNLNDTSFKQRFDRLNERLTLLGKTGKPLPLDSWIEELYQEINDTDTMESVVGELHAMLSKVEQAIDGYLRKNEDPTVLSQAIDDMQQMHGILDVLGHDQAAQATAAMRKQVQWLHKNHGINGLNDEREEIINTLSNSLGAFGFLVNMIGHQPLVARELFVFDKDKQELQLLIGRDKTAHTSSKKPENKVNDEYVETQSTQKTPELEEHIEPIDLELNNIIGESEHPSTEPASTNEAAYNTVESDDDFGDDLRDIFLEEALEVVNMAKEDLAQVKNNVSNRDALTAVRRGFHTLKGSSRMVGLMEYGEAAWVTEQCLNEWLTIDSPASKELLSFSEWALNELSAWADDLQNNTDNGHSASTFEEKSKNASPATAARESIEKEQDKSLSSSTEELDILSVSPENMLDIELEEDADGESIESLIPDYSEQTGSGFDFSNIDLSLDTKSALDFPEDDLEFDLENSFNLDDSFTAIDQSDDDKTVSDHITKAAEAFDFSVLEADDDGDSLFPPTEMLPLEDESNELEAVEEKLTLDDFEESEDSSFNIDTQDETITIGSLEINKPLYDIYIEEAQDRIKTLQDALLEWQATGSMKALENAQILAHAMAGSSSTVGYSELASFAKSLENSLEHYNALLDPNDIPDDRTSSTVFWKAGEEIQRILNLFEKKEISKPRTELLETLAEFTMALQLEETSGFDEIDSDIGQDYEIIDAPDSILTAKQLENGLDLEDNDFTADSPLTTLDSVYLESEELEKESIEKTALFQLDEEDRDAVISDIFEIFEEETEELLPRIREEINNWSATPHNKGHAQEALRILHTLKGNARLTGAKRLGNMVHQLESELDQLMKTDAPIASQISETLNQFNALSLEFDLLCHASEEVDRGLVSTNELASVIDDVVTNDTEEQSIESNTHGEDEASLISSENDSDELLSEFLASATYNSEVAEENTEAAVIEIEDSSEFLESSLSAVETEQDSVFYEAVSNVAQPKGAEKSLAIYKLAKEDQEAVNSDLFVIFKDEAIDLLAHIAQGFREWKSNQSEPLANDIHRALHTLKGSARLTGAMRLGSIVHDLESTLRKESDPQVNRSDLIHQIEKQFISAETEFDLLSQAADEIEKGVITLPLEVQTQPLAVHNNAEEHQVTPTPQTSVQPLKALQALDAIDRAAVGSDLFPSFSIEANRQIKLIANKLDRWKKEGFGVALVEALQAINGLRDNIRLANISRLDRVVKELDTALRTVIGTTPTADQVQNIVDLFSNANFEIDLLDTAAQELKESQEKRDEENVTSSDNLEEGAESILGVEESETFEDDYLDEDEHPSTSEATKVSGLTPRTIEPTAARQIASTSSSQMIRVRASLIDELVTKSGEVNMIRGQLAGEVRHLKDMLINELTFNLERLRTQLRDIEIQAETQMTSRMDATRAEGLEFDPLEFDRYTRIQELTRIMAESVNDIGTVQKSLMVSSTEVEDGLASQSRSARDIQHLLLRARMVKFSSITERFHRVVRLAASECNKEVRLIVEGGEIEIDRAVLDHVAPAFEHMLRNSVVHGIGTPERRKALGKDPVGQIKIILSQEGNDVSIILSDDGAGLDLDKIRVKAESINLIEPGSQTSDYDLAQMIYKSGLTTAEDVTELAGRGVGLDMAYAEIAGLGGRIEVITKAHEGTQFELLLPLTTAVTQVALVRIADKTFGIPVNLIESIQRFSNDEITQALKHGTIKHNDEYLPAYWLGGFLEVASDPISIKDSKLQWLVLKGAGQKIIVGVNAVIGSQEVVIKSVGPQFAHLTAFSGLTVLAGGLTVLIYNPITLARVLGSKGDLSSILINDFITDEEGQSVFQQSIYEDSFNLSTYTPPATPRSKRVMVVDDSLTVRKITERFLTRSGFEVILAKDGIDALDQLNKEIPALVLSDIEMPRMDGFEFVRQMRDRRETEDLPVIMITSRIAQKHHDYAKELGVSHYLGKPYDEEQLLKLVQEYVKNAPEATI